MRSRNERVRKKPGRRNPYARPASGPPAPPLPPVADCTGRGDETPAIVFDTGEQYSWDNPACWRLEYRCLYESGVQDRRLHVRSIIAATRGRAIETLQELLRWARVRTVELYAARGPMSPEELAFVREANEELEKERETTKSTKDTKK